MNSARRMKTMKIILAVMLANSFMKDLTGQNRIIINNNGYIVLKNNATLVVDNANQNAITTTGSGGNIISEGELNKVKWNIGTGSGNYTIPFTKIPGNKIPLSFNITSSGSGTGSVLFSTYGGPNWDNSTYLPSDVTNIYSSIGGSNNSANVIDRFWIIDAQGYTNKPAGTITFTYIDGEHTAAGNTISESTLIAQRFNSATNDWGAWTGPTGTANTTSNTVSSGTVAPANLFRSWTLVNQYAPLPIELLSFKVTCEEHSAVKFSWTTASEVNNDYFTIEGSIDAINWQILAHSDATGNSSVNINYEETVSIPDEYSFFRLKQTDHDGTYTYSEIVNASCNDGNEDEIALYPNPGAGEFSIDLGHLQNNSTSIYITNPLGQTLSGFDFKPSQEKNVITVNLTNEVNGIYLVTIRTDNKTYHKKAIIQR